MTWAPDYCTAAELKAFVRKTESVDDTQVALAVTAASRAIDHSTNRQFGKVGVAEARYFTARWDREICRWVVRIDDLMTTTDLAVATDSGADYSYAGAITAYDLKPLNAAAKGKPWTELVVRHTSGTSLTHISDAVRITALWGWTAVPDTIKQATLLQANRILSRRGSPFGIAGSPANGGSELRLLAKLDPDVEAMVQPYVRWWAAA